MARMSDEAFELLEENRERAITARSARNRRGHTGKGGTVRLSSDNLTKKQLEAKNGECKTYRMNDPMTWEQFKELPDDLKVCYIKAIRNKYKVPDRYLAGYMDTSASTFSKKMKDLRLSGGASGTRNWVGTDDWLAFTNWWFKKNNLPVNGAAKFESPMDHILKKLNEKLACLGDRKVCMTVSWQVMED